MRSEHLGIGDRTFLINRLIQQAPINMLIREFFKNADENAALAPEGHRTVEIFPTLIDGVRKLTFWNTGVGMSAAELKTATDLSSSVNKMMSLDGNFGIGAKVSGLTASPDGIRYRSCKNAEVNEVTIGYDENESTYVRFTVQLPDGSSEAIYDVTSTVLAEGKSVDEDWTEVVLFGEGPTHDTVAEPIGVGVAVDRSFIATSIFRRFVQFSPGVQVRVDVAMTKGGGKEETGKSRQLKTLDDVLDRLPRFEDVTDTTTGVTIRYIYDPKHEGSGHAYSARANAATGSTTFCALVYKGERYDFRTQKVWSSVAPIFGVPFGSKVLTIEIRLPDQAAFPSQYRESLTWRHDRSPLTADHYAYLVRELMPDWVKDVIRSESPDGADDLNDLQSDLQMLLDELRVPTKVMKRSSDPTDRSERNSAGIAEPEPTTLQSEQDEETPAGPVPSTKRTESRASKTRVRYAPDGATASRLARALERAPEIKILNDLDEIADHGLKGRAAKFYGEVQTLFVNGLYPVVTKMADELANEFSDAEDPDEARSIALQASQRTLAYRVGKATCFALAKRLLDDWSTEDLERATSPESLSMAADDYRQSLAAGRKWIKDRVKIASVTALG
ncbi:MAG: ATP-binding protein [Mesorhizobium sp.]|nr:MAG: ATP-binding protein [Mesorhizobium sp.]